MEEEKEIKMFQNIKLELSNGKAVEATVPAFMSSKQADELDIKVVSISITEPISLPKGSFFEVLEIKAEEDGG